MSRCSLCPGKFNCVAADGPEDSDYLFIGEACGGDEDRRKIPFVGKTGREVNEHYLPLTGLRRGNVRFDNAISCRPDRPRGKLNMGRQADRDLLQACADHHLYPDLERLTPSLLIPMGAFACYALDQTIELDLQHGMPTKTVWGSAFPMWHPAGGIHEPKKMLQIRTDWIRLRKHITGRLQLVTDQYAGKEQYAHLQRPQDVCEVLRGSSSLPMACDTEITRQGQPYCLTFSVETGTGYLIRSADAECLGEFQKQLNRWTGPVLFHNWLFDGSVVAKMGLRFPRRLIRDTMMMAFHLGNLPQGLKALSYRELGMRMQDFNDLVEPYSRKLVLDYYRLMYEEEWPKPEAELVREDDGGWKLYRPQSMTTKLKRFFTDLEKSDDKDPFKMWTDNWEDSHQMVEDVLGPWPGRCITHVPFEKVIHYACRDADATLRIWPMLNWMRRQVRRGPQENWQKGWAA